MTRTFDITCRQTDELMETLDNETLTIYRTAPKLLAALKAILPYAKDEVRMVNLRNDGTERDEAEAGRANAAVAEAKATIALAEGRVA